AQLMRQLEMVVATLVSNATAVFRQRPFRPFVAMRTFHLARQLALQLARLANTLHVELRTGVDMAFIVGEEAFQPEIEAAAFTRADSLDAEFLNHTKDQPQTPHAIALDGQGFNLSVQGAVFHKF